MEKRQTIFSGVQPSGQLTLGNYIGAISQWADLQITNRCIFSIVDYHAITVRQEPAELREKITEIAKLYLASGIDPKNSIIFQQSALPQHTELAWILNCCAARVADLNKMTQFKDKAGKNQESVSAGLYDYPVLMAADILLYDTDLVPVGEDQAQHVELARDIAKRFNGQWGEVFKVPTALIKKEGARIMSLQDPSKKMSKSDPNQSGCIYLLDDIDAAKKKIMRAVTDSGQEIKYDIKKKPAVSNLLTIYSALSQKGVAALEREYVGRGYGDFKKDLAEVVAKFLTGFQGKYQKISDKQIDKVLHQGSKEAGVIAEKKMELDRQAIGVR